MHLPAQALPGASALLLDPAGQVLQQRVFSRPPSMQHSLVPQTRTLLNLDAVVVGGATPSGAFSKSFTGPIFAGSTLAVVAALATPVTLNFGTPAGLLVVRDNTTGGSAIWLIDPNQGAIQVANNITKTITVAFSGGAWRLTQTAGAAPTTYACGVLATG